MPRPRSAPSPDERQTALPLAKAPARRATSTPEQIAQVVTAKLKRAAVTRRLVLPRTGLERRPRA